MLAESAPAQMSAHASAPAVAFDGCVRTRPRNTIAYAMEKSATRYACRPARRRNAASPTSADGTERALYLAAAEAPDRDAEADDDPGDRPHEIQRRGRFGRE